MKLVFISKNPHKVKEFKALFKRSKIDFIHLHLPIEELQTQDENSLVRDKVLKAYKECGLPLFVEHTSLHISFLDGFPGGLTELFWEKLKHEKFSSIIGNFEDNTIYAKTTIGYCDGKNIYFFQGEIKGTVPPMPRGRLDFQWDAVFVPDGYDKTFGEMPMKEKNKISMRKLAYSKFLDFLKKNG